MERAWRPDGSAMPASPVTPNCPNRPSHPTKTGQLGQTGQEHADQANQGVLNGHIDHVGPRQLAAGGLQGEPGREPKHAILDGRLSHLPISPTILDGGVEILDLSVAFSAVF